MFNHNIKSPGVYINETDAFPKSVVPVATAVPAFIGYTPQASYEGKSYFSKAQKIKSLAQFQEIYCHPNPSGKADTVKQYNPQFYAVKQIANLIVVIIYWLKDSTILFYQMQTPFIIYTTASVCSI